MVSFKEYVKINKVIHLDRLKENIAIIKLSSMKQASAKMRRLVGIVNSFN